ncbi:MAG: pyridoxal-phosphate dependent enzyme, partial [Atopobiaceae bacterium]|nr:pyridoxal-phosphate dependent enzyme [Atopobiaceae bacterium]
ADVTVVAVEPAESPVLSGGSAGAHRIQGIGAGFVPDTYDAEVVDRVQQVASDVAITIKQRLAKELGVFVGISSGAAVAGAIALVETGEFDGKTIVAILPDTGERYLSMDV